MLYKNRLIDPLRIAPISLALLLAFAAAAQPAQTVTINVPIGPDYNLPVWTNGFLPLYYRAQGSGTPWLLMFDRNGNQVIPKTDLAIPDATRTVVHSVTASRLGTLFASVEAWTGSGQGTGAIAVIPVGGKSIHLVATGQFVAKALAVTPAGELWALGVPIEEQTAIHVTDDYPTLERFDSQGHLLGQYLLRSTFGKDVEPARTLSGLGRPILMPIGQVLGILSPASNRWLEIDTQTQSVINNVPLGKAALADGTGLTCIIAAATDSYGPYASCKSVGNSPIQRELFRLNRSTGQWQLLDGHNLPARFLGGSDGDSLILATMQNTYVWVDASSLVPVRP